ncbi:hypothetical protein J057_14995 [Marinobacter nanhaiticus D15-8W]|uniref:Uncharacterized protein n=1 Tax=Marinobacter nanhaiticus D15-8W TaxID=626887 RepID=N6VXZ9_9GAMM|nr:hypothetical protein J057_14995 [Marinobacter nanhaiticus D15-8W]
MNQGDCKEVGVRIQASRATNHALGVQPQGKTRSSYRWLFMGKFRRQTVNQPASITCMSASTGAVEYDPPMTRLSSTVTVQ